VQRSMFDVVMPPPQRGFMPVNGNTQQGKPAS
jgi:hypothetical protein